MKQLSKTFLITFLLISAGFGCSTFSPYKVPVLQGNIIEDKDVEQLTQGLSKDQVQYLLGTPLLKSPIHQQRWDYFYSVKVGDMVILEKKLFLIFDKQNKLDSWVIEESNPEES
ncbi:outer membrane protein assembly factor BamE [Gammaproteobacteria bacterium]|nr:outer membrane protein assembly factor BamE [Gammaproteobacteria bacterium]